jgi:hypothetical protein
MDEQQLKRHCDDMLIERIDGLKDIFLIFKEQNEKDHMSLIAQTTKTNGSVAKAFVEIDLLKQERSERSGVKKALGYIFSAGFGGGIVWSLINLIK